MILNQTSLHIENNQSINNLIPEESVAILKIKSLLAGFKEKLNVSLDENSNINEKIKSDVCKIYNSKCEKHLEKLKIIEKSVEKYEALPSSQKTEKIINHLAQRYKQIDKWELDSDDLIEKITIKALEFSYKTQPEVNQQNHLTIQTLMDQMTELKNMVKMNQNPMEPPPIENLTHSIIIDNIESLNDSKSSSWQQIEEFSKSVDKKEAKKIEKKKGEIKGDIRMVKLGVKECWADDKTKKFIKKIDDEQFQVIKDRYYLIPLILTIVGMKVLL